MLILSIIAFIVILSFLFISHEYGHFLAAKRAGVPVLRFGIGFLTPLIKWKRNETEYSINILPFGAFVDVMGMEDPNNKDNRSYWSQSIGKRILIAAGGVISNFFWAWVLLTISLWIYAALPPKNFVLIQEVKKESSAEQAGLKQGDLIISADGLVFKSAEEISSFTRSHKDQTVKLIIKRSGKDVEKNVKLGADPEAPLGISMSDAAFEDKVAFWKAPLISIEVLGQAIYMTAAYFGKAIASIFTHTKVPIEVSGPVGIWSFVSQFTALGIVYLLRLAAFLSLGIGFLNLLPIPSLDGSRIVFLLLEKIFGKKVVKPEVENTIHTVGFIFLMLIMVLITYKDITRLMGK